jgi:hypothetical protein
MSPEKSAFLRERHASFSPPGSRVTRMPRSATGVPVRRRLGPVARRPLPEPATRDRREPRTPGRGAAGERKIRNPPLLFRRAHCPSTNALVQAAEAASKITCETWGAPGTLLRRDALRTRTSKSRDTATTPRERHARRINFLDLRDLVGLAKRRSPDRDEARKVKRWAGLLLILIFKELRIRTVLAAPS